MVCCPSPEATVTTFPCLCCCVPLSRSNLTLVPKSFADFFQAPKKDIKKFMEHANNQLKFQLKLKGGDPSNAIRYNEGKMYFAQN